MGYLVSMFSSGVNCVYYGLKESMSVKNPERSLTGRRVNGGKCSRAVAEKLNSKIPDSLSFNE